MLFKIAERERLKDRNAKLEESLESQAVRIQILERRNAELEARDVEKTARIAELEKQKAQQNDEERQ